MDLIKNYAEKLVERILENLLENNSEYAHICKCDDCMDDIKAKALNNIKPFYITGKIGEVYGEYFMRECQNNTNIVIEVAKAIEHVNSNKNHDNSFVKYVG